MLGAKGTMKTVYEGSVISGVPFFVGTMKTISMRGNSENKSGVREQWKNSWMEQ
jgi:hypothetical protein